VLMLVVLLQGHPALPDLVALLCCCLLLLVLLLLLFVERERVQLLWAEACRLAPDLRTGLKPGYTLHTSSRADRTHGV